MVAVVIKDVNEMDDALELSLEPRPSHRPGIDDTGNNDEELQRPLRRVSEVSASTPLVEPSC